MCGRLANGATPEQIAAWYASRREAFLALRSDAFPLPRYNTAPGDRVAVLLDDAGPHLEPMTWGIWAELGPAGVRRLLFNARSEKYLGGGRSYWRRGWRRALVVASCFFEWDRGQPHAIRLAQDELLAFGALWREDEIRRGKRDEDPHRGPLTVILTTEPNPLVRRFHHRAPVVVLPQHWDAWLDPTAPPELIERICRPLPDELMRAYPVSDEVGKVGTQSPRFLDPLPQKRPGQLSLL